MNALAQMMSLFESMKEDISLHVAYVSSACGAVCSGGWRWENVLLFCGCRLTSRQFMLQRRLTRVPLSTFDWTDNAATLSS